MQTRIIAVLAAVACFFSSIRADEPQATVIDLGRSIEQLEERVNSLSVNATFDILHRYFPGEDSQDVSLTSLEWITVDREGRCRVQVDTQSFRKLNGGIEKTPKVAIGVFDGKVARVMEGQSTMSSGTVSSLRSEIPLRLDPRNISTHYFFKPLSQILTKRGAVVVGQVIWDGRPVIVVETTPIEGNDRRKFRFYVDPERDFTVVRRAIAVQYPPHERWMEYTRIECFDFEQIEPEVWLPGRIVHESFDPTVQNAKDGSEPPLSWRWKVSWENWKVNEECQPEIFELKFAPGVFVNDRITGRNYTVQIP